MISGRQAAARLRTELSAENDTVEEMIQALERKAPSVTNEIFGTSDNPEANGPKNEDKSVPRPAMPKRQSSKAKVVFE